MTKEELTDELHYRSSAFKAVALGYEFLINDRNTPLRVIGADQSVCI